MFSNKICWSLRDLWNKFFKKTNTKKKQTQHYNKLPEKNSNTEICGEHVRALAQTPITQGRQGQAIKTSS